MKGISTMNIHSVVSLRIVPGTIQVNNETRHTCDVIVKDENGNSFALTLFSDKRLGIELGGEA